MDQEFLLNEIYIVFILLTGSMEFLFQKMQR